MRRGYSVTGDGARTSVSCDSSQRCTFREALAAGSVGAPFSGSELSWARPWCECRVLRAVDGHYFVGRHAYARADCEDATCWMVNARDMVARWETR